MNKQAKIELGLLTFIAFILGGLIPLLPIMFVIRCILFVNLFGLIAFLSYLLKYNHEKRGLK
jgi:VIT1/CCC1 family predicted Fe2+/Mn2+ transporter